MVQWTMELNNLLQCNGKAGQVTYESNHEGPDNQGFWRVTALYNGLATGVGIGKTKMEAKELASKDAMKALYPNQYRSFGGT